LRTQYVHCYEHSWQKNAIDKYMTIIYYCCVMEIVSIPEFEGFEWDKGNIQKNWLAHEVTKQEAEQLFFNSPLIVAKDPAHSKQEKRFMVLGQTDTERYLFIAFTMRKGLIRVISARDMSRKERKIYSS